jgi:hypothetical protein
MTDDLVDDFYRPLVQPLGNLVILCAQCEASLLDLVAALQDCDEWQAQAVLKAKGARDRLLERDGFRFGHILRWRSNWRIRSVRRC